MNFNTLLKKGGFMPEVQGVSNERLSNLAKKAAARAVKKEKERIENHIPEEMDQDDITDLLTSDIGGSETKLITNGPGFDLFDHCQKLLDQQQVQAVYTISKNGELLCTKHHPYSWERLQREYGGGHYQIVAKTVNGKQYIKMDTRTVADLALNTIKEDEKEGTPSMFENFMVMMQQQREQDRREMKEALERQKAEEERRRLEEKERTKEAIASTQSQSMMLIEMMKMMNEKSERSTLELARLQQQAEERTAKANEKSTQMMIQMMQMQIESLKSKKDEGFSTIELMTMMKEAEENGYKKMAELLTLARAEAEERIAMRGEDSGEKKEKKTLTDTLIESMLPTITTALAGQATQALTQPKVAPTRRGLPPARTEPVRQGSSKPIAKQGNIPSGQGKVSSKSSSLNAFGLPTASFDVAEEQEKEVTPLLSNAVNLPTVEEIENWLSPVITEALLNQTPPNEAAPKVVEVVEKHGLSKENFCKIMTEDKLLGLVTKYGLPELAFDWFKELHAHISTTTGNDDREHTRGS
ncbi:MAG: hypothetical protein H7836_04390 [Magnetococcus sp. YQC-3]